MPLARWLLAPWPTWKLWRRMVLWQVTSYRAALNTEQQRLRALYRLRHRYGQHWHQHVPDDLAWMLRDGVLLDDAFGQIAKLTGDTPQPARSPETCAISDEELAADMCARWPTVRPSRESVRLAYRIGSGRARRILNRWTHQQPLAEDPIGMHETTS